MSYYKLKSARFNKNENKITLKVADSSLSPLYYFESDFGGKDMSYEQKIEYFFVDMLQGNIQGGTGKVRSIYQTLSSLVKTAPETSFEKDLNLGVGRCNGLEHLVSKIVGVPLLMNQSIDMESVKKILDKYEEDSKEIYEAKKNEIDSKNWLITGACSKSDVFPGYNVFVYPEGNELILAEHSCYMSDHLGYCDTTKGKVFHLGNNSEHFFFLLSNGYDRSIYEAFPDEGERKIVIEYIDQLMDKLSELEIGKLPYPEYQKKAA